tara:strand:- start:1478 stop:1708 length:231 start_codon:yes stop_codon:yes gene_type:complete
MEQQIRQCRLTIKHKATEQRIIEPTQRRIGCNTSDIGIKAILLVARSKGTRISFIEKAAVGCAANKRIAPLLTEHA